MVSIPSIDTTNDSTHYNWVDFDVSCFDANSICTVGLINTSRNDKNCSDICRASTAADVPRLHNQSWPMQLLCQHSQHYSSIQRRFVWSGSS